MTIAVLQVSAPSLGYICLGGFVALFSIVSLLVKETLYINEVVLGTGFGVVVGPYVANVFDPRGWGAQENRITLEVLRVILAIGLFGVGVELPRAYMKHHAKGLLVMIVPTMAFGWIIVYAILHTIFPVLDQVSALCIAACLTPTDPVTCAVITRGKFATENVREDIRHILSAESASNDGLAYPFLSIAIYITVETSTREAIEKWLLVGCLYQVILGTILGAVLGSLFSKSMKLTHRKSFIDRESFIAQYLALSIFTVGVASCIGVDDLLASFAAGCAISWDGNFNVQTADDSFSSVIDFALNCACFIYIGAWLPFESYNSPELGITPWRLVVSMIAILVLRRIPPLLLLYWWIPEVTSWKEALFCGHFGPMGVSALFVSVLAVSRLPAPANPPENQAQLLAAMIPPLVSFMVLGSIIVHGLSIPFFTLGRGVQSRTAAFSYKWTRTRTWRNFPEWELSTRRPGNGIGAASATVTDVDVECGMETNRGAFRESEAKVDQTGIGLSSAVDVAIHVAMVREVVPDIGGRIPGCGVGDGEEATEATQVVEKDRTEPDAHALPLISEPVCMITSVYNYETS